jgi:two-component system OmpR family sensor kinase
MHERILVHGDMTMDRYHVRDFGEEMAIRTMNEMKTTLLSFMIISTIVIAFFGALISYIVSKRALGQIKDGYKKMESFVSDASHELRTPLSILKGYTELYRLQRIQFESDTLRLEAANNTIEKIWKNTNRMETLVNDLLILVRLEGETAQDLENVDILPLIKDIFNQLNMVNTVRNVHIRTDMESVVININEQKIWRVFMNLAQNIYRYTPEDTEIEVHIKTSPLKVKIDFIDHGEGLQQDEMLQMYERFWTRSKGRSREDSGTGLGLSIVKTIAESYGGTVIPSKTPGGGLTQTVILPR